MISRDDFLISLKPEINTIDYEKHINPIEEFQNSTLRPIIKFHHEFWIQSFKRHLKLRKNVFFNLTTSERELYIANIFNSDINYKKEVINNIVSFFTTEELSFYYKNISELNKRITNILHERYLDISKNL